MKNSIKVCLPKGVYKGSLVSVWIAKNNIVFLCTIDGLISDH